MIFVGDMLKITMDAGAVKAGTMFTVTGVSPNGVIAVVNERGTGCLSVDEIGKLFEKVELPQRVWSEWKWAHNQYGEYRYRTNGKNVQVELWNGFRSKASCHPDDDFVLEAGIALAFQRATEKFWKTVNREFGRKHAEMFTA